MGERERLLDAAIDYVAANGITDLSLRQLAAEVGTSHRMLSHYFGSKDGLWVAIVGEVERRQRDAVADVLPPPGTASLEDTMRAWWKHISKPALWPNERLFFEMYGQALQGREPASELLHGVVDSWVEATVAYGLPRAYARLSVAVTRGLLLDLLATGNRRAVDAAMEEWIALSGPVLASGPSKRAGASR